MLAHVAYDIRNYLLTRDNTIKEVIGMMFRPVEDDDDQLAEELRCDLQRDGCVIVDTKHVADDEDEPVDYADEDWQPLPRFAQFKPPRNASDILNALVSIYPSTATFIQEFQEYLNQRLLQVVTATNTSVLVSDAIDREITHVELLKLRFGDESMTQCQVMLSDVEDSLRLGSRIIHPTQLSALIVSHLYWPAVSEVTFCVPKSMLSMLDEYE